MDQIRVSLPKPTIGKLARQIASAAAMLIPLCGTANARAGQIWLSGVDAFVIKAMNPNARSDYLNLFDPNAPWSQAASAVQVFKTSTQFLQYAPDADLSRMFAGLKQRNIALGMEAMMLTPTSQCGAGIEGYRNPTAMADIAARIRRLGGDLRYVAMDEPVDGGHYSHQPNACQAPLSDLAADVAGKARQIRQIFPDVEIGDIEQIGNPNFPDNVRTLMEWIDDYQNATGTPLAFVDFDVVWTGDWRPQLTELTKRLHDKGIKVGIIYDGNADDPSDVAWTTSAEQRFAAIEADRSLVPDQAILQTWMLHPAEMLPETEPGTMTYLVDRYLAAETRLTLKDKDHRLSGQLTDADGQPEGGQTLRIVATDTGPAGGPTVRTLASETPPQAAEAILALRINTECSCSGSADVTIGPMSYRDDQSGQQVPLSLADTHFAADEGEAASQNTSRFPVSPGDPFTLQVPMSASYASRNSGYVGIIFLDRTGREIERLRMPFQPQSWQAATVTRADGRFSVDPAANPAAPAFVRDHPAYEVEFAGSPALRMTSAATGK